MTAFLALNRFNIQIPDAGIVRIVAGATVTVYETMPDGTAAVTVDGVVRDTAVKSTLYADRAKAAGKNNPIVSDTQGLVEFYVSSTEVHLQVVTPSGLTYGIPWYFINNHFTEIQADDFPSIQAAIDAVPIEGAIVQLKAGYYNITTPILFPTDRPVWLRGVGPNNYLWGFGTIIHNVAPDRDQDSIHIRGDFQRISDLNITYNSVTGAPTGVGIRVGTRVGAVLRETWISNVSIFNSGAWGIQIEGVETAADGRLAIFTTLDRVHVSHNQSTGCISVETGCTTVKLNECKFTQFVGIGLQLLGTDIVNVDGCTFEETDGSPILIAGGNTYNRSTTINGCYFEEPSGSAVHFITFNAGTIMSPTVRGCIFIRNNAGIQYVKAIKINTATCYNLLVENAQGHCAFVNPYVATDDISIGANSFYATIIGAILVSKTGGSIAFYKMSVLDAGTGTAKLGNGV